MIDASKWECEDMRRVRYVGENPILHGLTGRTYFDLDKEVEMFAPDKPIRGLSQWFRVRLENLERLD